MLYSQWIQKLKYSKQMVENIDSYGFFMSYQSCYMLFNIQTIMSTRFKLEKSWMNNVNHHFRICVSALTGSPCMMSRDQLLYVMMSSASHCDAFILSGTDTSIRGIRIWSLKINPFSGKVLNCSLRTFWSIHVYIYNDRSTFSFSFGNKMQGEFYFQMKTKTMYLNPFLNPWGFHLSCRHLTVYFAQRK